MVGVGGPKSVVGGPLCGLRPGRFPGAGWMWLSVEGGVRTRPTKGHECYRYSAKAERWIYAGHLWQTCPGCGAQHERAEKCQLCGSALAS